MSTLLNLISNGIGTLGLDAYQLSILFIIMMFAGMIIGLALGQELCFVMGGIGVVVGFLAFGSSGITVTMTKVFDAMNSYTNVAMPMFILMANFLSYSKVADGLFESIRYLLGPLKGGLGLAVILVSTVFAATTGIVGASVITMGMLSFPVLMKANYNKSLTCGIISAGGCLGILIPPSIMLVSMGSYAQVSVGKLFFAAIIPGLCLSACYAIYVLVICHIHPDYGPAMSEAELAAMPLKKRITGSLKNLIPPLLLIFGVLGSIFGGIATPTEASGMGAFLALLLTMFYRQFSLKMLYDSIIGTAKTCAMVFSILFMAGCFTGTFMAMNGDVVVMNVMNSLGIGKIGAIMILFVLVFIMGCFLDWTGIIMIVLPIFLPIMDNFGVDRLWLCATLAVLLQTCFMTPPFGFALFFMRGIVPPGVKMTDVYKGVVPFLAIVIFMGAVCVAFPQIVTWLPNTMIG